MSIQANQLQIPFTQAESDKLAGVAANAEPQPPIASQAEALAGTDNMSMMTPLRVIEVIEANLGASTSNSGIYTNNSGSTMAALTLVSEDSSGNMALVITNSASSVKSLLGVLTQSTANTATGIVVFEGLIENISTSFNLQDIIYLNSDGTLTNTIPDYGVNGFAAGYFVVEVGKITKNSSNSSNKDLLVRIKNQGQL